VVPPGDRKHKDAALACLDRVGMRDYADRQISQLSGGQQQRVFLARALAQEADLYFMDEPFAGVDAATERAIVEVLRELKGGRDGDRGAPRPADGARVLRRCDPAQHAGRRGGAGGRGVHASRTCTRPTAGA
jgi:hypothetical protein